MPCYDSRDDIRTVYEKGHDPAAQRRADELKRRLDEVTDLLCKAGRARYNGTKIPAAVLKWWDDHCKIDKSRGEPW